MRPIILALLILAEGPDPGPPRKPRDPTCRAWETTETRPCTKSDGTTGTQSRHCLHAACDGPGGAPVKECAPWGTCD